MFQERQLFWCQTMAPPINLPLSPIRRTIINPNYALTNEAGLAAPCRVASRNFVTGCLTADVTSVVSIVRSAQSAATG